MADPSDLELEQRLSEAARRHPNLELLVLHGSRTRADARAQSDWDFGFISKGPVDVLALAADLSTATASDRIDVVDLARASGLLRYRAARDGRLLFERERGSFERFWLDAVRFWCEVGEILDRGYRDVLARLDR